MSLVAASTDNPRRFAPLGRRLHSFQLCSRRGPSLWPGYGAAQAWYVVRGPFSDGSRSALSEESTCKSLKRRRYREKGSESSVQHRPDLSHFRVEARRSRPVYIEALLASSRVSAPLSVDLALSHPLPDHPGLAPMILNGS